MGYIRWKNNTMQHAQAIKTLANIHSLPLSERKTLMRQKFADNSRFQREFSADSMDLDAGSYAQQLRDEIIRLLAEKGVQVPGGDLENLHKTLPPEQKEYNFNDGVNKLSTLLYDTDEKFIKAYHGMIKNCVYRHFPYPFYFQATTTIRIHCPEGENNDHYPRYHTDINYGHPPEEINLWIPLTEPQAPQYHGFRRSDVQHTREILDAFDYDFAPFIDRAVNDKEFNRRINEVAPQVTTPFGKISAFDSRCIHTGEPLLNHTRASIDIRIIALEDYESLDIEYQGTGRRQIRYVPGQAYYPLSSDKL